MKNIAGTVYPYIELCKIRIAFLSSCSAAAGFILPSVGVGPRISVLMLGVFLLACGASALNQYQERDLDALMPRTMGRPVPSGRIRPVDALLFSLLVISLGLLTLLLSGSLSAPVLGVLAVLWYNGLYTLLKKRTAFAVIPGAFVGAVPVVLGWVAGGGAITDARITALCFFFFMWQVPHSWLFILKYGREYERAGIPSLTAVFSGRQLLRINSIWITATAVSCLLITVSGAIRNFSVNLLLTVLSAWLVWNGLKLLGEKRGGAAAYSLAFSNMNNYLLCVIVLLVSDKLYLP